MLSKQNTPFKAFLINKNMAKDTFYFSHDYNCRNDIKIKKLLSRHGYLGYGLFWAIIEDLYNNTNVLRTDYDTIAFDLRCDYEVIKSIINDFDLFVFDGDNFGSLSVQKRLEERNEKSVKARLSVLKRWQKKESDTNVLQSNYDANTIKESKGKEIKENNIEERKLKFAATIKPFLETYSKEMCNKFYNYWTEENKSKTKLKFELEKTWNIEKRLKRWSDNNFEKKDNNTPASESWITKRIKEKYSHLENKQNETN